MEIIKIEDNEPVINTIDLMIKEFFHQLEKRILMFFQQKNGIEKTIRKILDNNENNLNSSLNFISSKIGEFLITYSNNNNTSLTIPLKEKSKNLIKIKNNNNFSLEDEREKQLDKIENDILKEKIKEKYLVVQGKFKDNILIPENGCKYQYYFCKTNANCVYLACADYHCNGKVKIMKENLNYVPIHDHDKNYFEHTYVIRNYGKNEILNEIKLI